MTPKSKATDTRPVPTDVDDGRQMMHKIFVESKVITALDFEQCWVTPDLSEPPDKVIEPFIQVLVDKSLVPLEKSLKLISDKARLGYFSLEKYDVDVEIARTFPTEVCQRWCVLPFDRMSKSILVATANPFNRQAALELEAATKQRLLWYLSPPPDIVKSLRKIFR